MGEVAGDPTRPFDLLVVGEVNPDVIVADPDPRPAFGQAERIVGDIRLAVGSSSVIMACAAARLGLRVAMVGVVGDDVFGRFMLDAMREHGLDVNAVRVIHDLPTGASVILTDGRDRAILTAAGTIGAVTASDVPADLLRRARHLHIGSWFLQDGLRPDAARLLRVRARGWAHDFTGPELGLGGLGWGSAGRAAVAGPGVPQRDRGDPDRRHRRRAGGCRRAGPCRPGRGRGTEPGMPPAGPMVVVKRGADGALAATADGATARVGPYPVTALDTTGAGDAFDAGFLVAWLEGAGRAATPSGPEPSPVLSRRQRSAASTANRPVPPSTPRCRRGRDDRPVANERFIGVSLNAAIDKIAAVDRLERGRINRPELLSTVPGGKAINAVRVARTLGAEADVVAVVAGHAGSWVVDQLEVRGIRGWFVRVDGEKRTCLSVLDRASGELTEFYEPGLVLPDDRWASVEAALGDALADRPGRVGRAPRRLTAARCAARCLSASGGAGLRSGCARGRRHRWRAAHVRPRGSPVAGQDQRGRGLGDDGPADDGSGRGRRSRSWPDQGRRRTRAHHDGRGGCRCSSPRLAYGASDVRRRSGASAWGAATR